MSATIYQTERYLQLSFFLPSQHRLSETEQQKLAAFITTGLSTFNFTQSYFKKNLFDIPRSLICNYATNDTFILLKRKTNLLYKTSTFKKVTSAIVLPSLFTKDNTLPSLAAQWVSKDTLDPINYQICVHDARIHELFSGLPGIWPQLAWQEYKKNTISKITAFTPIAEGDLSAVSCNEGQMIHIALQIIQGVHSLHQQGYVHGDLKLSNILKNADEVGLIDFGLAFKVGVDAPSHAYREGYYGSVVYTSPEVLGVKNFAGDYFKTEIWALGCLLATLRKHPQLHWISPIKHYYE